MKHVKAPNTYSKDDFLIFLCGSIEMGNAENWQDKIAESLRDLNVTILNPRRDDWDSSWVQDISNPKFREQVEWELEALENADMILVYFDPNTKSPITLLELGLFIDVPMIVCCPQGYWRKGNVDIVCKRYGINQVETLDDLIFYAKEILKSWIHGNQATNY